METKDKRFIVDAGELAAIFGVTQRYIYKLNAQGMPKLDRGKFDLAECVQHYLSQKETPANTDVNEQRRLLYEAQTEKIKLEMAERTRELVEAVEVQHVLGTLAVVFSSQLDAIGARLANELVGLTDVGLIKEQIDDETSRIRASVSSIVDDWAQIEDSGGDSETATEA